MSTIHQAASKLKGRIRKKRLNALRSLFKCPHKKGIVVRCRIMTPKKPNSAKRKVARIYLSNKYTVTTKIKGRNYSFINRFANVLVCGGRANDLPGVRYNMVKGKYDFNWKEVFQRMHGRSKYGIKWDDHFWQLREQIEKLQENEENEY